MQAQQQQPALTSIDDRKATRVDIERKVAFRFENLEGFMTEYLLNLSATGMFIRCQDPQPKGSVLDFEFALADGENLIRGYGEVMWARRRDGGPDKPAGMGVRFLHLDAETRDLLSWFVTRRYITGGGPCDMEELREEMRRADGEEQAAADPAIFAPPAPPPPGAPPANGDIERPAGVPRSGSRGYREFGYAAVRGERRATHHLRLVAAIAAVALGGLYGLSRVAVPVAAWTQARAAAAVAEPTAPATPAAPQEKAAEASPGEPAPIVADLSEVRAEDRRMKKRQLAELASTWAAAWSDQEVDAYLGCYASDYRPPDGRSHAEWAASRRARILKPRRIEVRLAGVTAELVEANRARVRFEQAYRSDRFSDTVHKTLELVREEGTWRILEERVES